MTKFINLICYKIQTASLSSTVVSRSTLSSEPWWHHSLFSLLLFRISHSSSLSPFATNHSSSQTPSIQSRIPKFILITIKLILTSTFAEYLLEFYYNCFIRCRNSDSSFLNETDWSYSYFNVSSGWWISTALCELLFFRGLMFS